MISVTDNGIGLNKENQNKIFEKFYRVQSGNIHDTKGFGLGLNYVKSIIDAHNGTISVESKLKEGTTFNLYLPYKNN
jgi:signal transduction histidine kinase